MNHKLIDILQSDMSGLAFADVVAGVAYPLKLRVRDEEKIIPAYYNHLKDNCKTSDYVNLVPNSTKKSIIYFEDNGTTADTVTANYTHYTGSIRLVAWLNFKHIDLSLYDHSDVVQDILSRISNHYGNYGIYNRLYFTVTGIITNTSDIFARYTYDEQDSQYLTYPFYAVAIDIQARYTMSNNCITPVELNPASCLR